MILLKYCSLIYLVLVPAFAEKIQNCPSGKIKLSDEAGNMWLDGYFDAELRPGAVGNVLHVHDLKFNGYIQSSETQMKFTTSIDSIKIIRVQYLSEFEYQGRDEIETRQCNVEFIENDDSFIELPDIDNEILLRSIEDSILEKAESCIENLICQNDNFENIAYQDQVYVKPRSQIEIVPTSSQTVLNAFIDMLIENIRNAFVDSNNTLLLFPGFHANDKGFLEQFDLKASGGFIDILKYVRRIDDFSFINEGSRYIFGTTFDLTGGKAVLNIEHLTVSNRLLGEYSVNGSVLSTANKTTLRLEVAVGYNQLPCRVHAEEIKLHGLGDVDLDNLTTRGTGFTDQLAVEALKGLAYVFIDSLVERTTTAVTDELSNLISQIECEDYRSVIFYEDVIVETKIQNRNNVYFPLYSIGKAVLKDPCFFVVTPIACLFSFIYSFFFKVV